MMHNFATSCDSYAYISTLTQRTEEQNQTSEPGLSLSDHVTDGRQYGKGNTQRERLI